MRSREDGLLYGLSFEAMRERIGLDAVRRALSASERARALVPVVDAAADYSQGWFATIDAHEAELADVGALERILKETVGFGFTELLDRARLDRALVRLQRSDGTPAEIAREYHESRPRCSAMGGVSCRGELDLDLRRLLDVPDRAVVALSGHARDHRERR